jgi:hypothetical protein
MGARARRGPGHGSVLDPMRYPLGAVYLDIDPGWWTTFTRKRRCVLPTVAQSERPFQDPRRSFRTRSASVAVRTWNRGRPSEPGGLPRGGPGVPLGAAAASDAEARLPWSFPAGATRESAPASGATTSTPDAMGGASVAADAALAAFVSRAEGESRPYPLLETLASGRPSFARLGFIAQVKQTI